MAKSLPISLAQLFGRSFNMVKDLHITAEQHQIAQDEAIKNTLNHQRRFSEKVDRRGPGAPDAFTGEGLSLDVFLIGAETCKLDEAACKLGAEAVRKLKTAKTHAELLANRTDTTGHNWVAFNIQKHYIAAIERQLGLGR